MKFVFLRARSRRQLHDCALWVCLLPAAAAANLYAVPEPFTIANLATVVE